MALTVASAPPVRPQQPSTVRSARPPSGLALAALCAATACGPRPTALLSERASFRGVVTIIENGDEGAAVRGELAFDRTAAHYQLTLRRDGHADSLVWLGDGQIRAFHDGTPVEPTPALRKALDRVIALVEPGPARAVGADATVAARWAHAYELVRGERRIRVELDEDAPSGAH